MAIATLETINQETTTKEITIQKIQPINHNIATDIKTTPPLAIAHNLDHIIAEIAQVLIIQTSQAEALKRNENFTD
jgi:hypothetical protein